MAIEHDSISDGERHEPKGISTATSSQVYVSDGLGSGVWTDLNTFDKPDGVISASEGHVFIADGAGSGDFKFATGGWEHFHDAGGIQTFNTTPAVMTNDTLGARTTAIQSPYVDQAGIATRWNVLNSAVAASTQDAITVCLKLPVTTITTAVRLKIEIDSSGLGATSPTEVVRTMYVDLTPGTETYDVQTSFASLVGFTSSNVKIFMSVDAGSIEITNPELTVIVNHVGATNA